MLWYFKKSVCLFLGLVALGIAAIIWDNYFLNTYPQAQLFKLFLCCIYMLLWVLICARIANIQAKKYMGGIMNIILSECDPERFILNFSPLLKVKTPLSKYHNMLLLELSMALVAAGRYEDAMETLKGIRRFPRNRFGTVSKIAYCNNVFSCYLNLQDYTSAENALIDMRKVMSSRKFEYNTTARNRNLYEVRCCQLNIERGICGGAERAMTLGFEHTGSELNRVNAKFWLGRIYLFRSEKEKAKAAFEYVAAHGNKIAKAETARNYLEKISQSVDHCN